MYPEKLNLESHFLARVRMGTDSICDCVKNGGSVAELIPQWEQSAEAFNAARVPYLLYP